MPRTLVPFHAPRRRARAGGQGLGAIGQAGSLASDPYRMHHPDALANGVGNAAAALFRAPVERAKIEDARAAREGEESHRAGREAKEDAYRERSLGLQEKSIDARKDAADARGTGAGRA
jgi:hypothetical protein